MPRPKSAEPYVRRHITLPKSIAERVDSMLTDPLLQTLTPGLWTKLITYLLRETLECLRDPLHQFDVDPALRILTKHLRNFGTDN